MAFRDDDEALRARVSSLEGELERANEETEALRRALAEARAPEPVRVDPPAPIARSIPGATPAPWQRPIPWRRVALPLTLCFVALTWLLAPPPAPAGTRMIWSASAVHPGEAVFAEWSGRWYAARVIATHRSSVRVHYDGLPSTDDEDVGFWRVRAPAH